MTYSGQIKLPVFGNIIWYGRTPQLDRSEQLFIGFSVRNRSFCKDFFRKATLLCKQSFRELLVAIFDMPYAYNEAAEEGIRKPSDEQVRCALRIGDERSRMVEKILNKGNNNINWSIQRWSSLDNVMVCKMREELRKALEESTELKEELLHFAIQWLKKNGRVNPEDFLEFQIQEIPVLTNIYYHHNFLVDIYPGDPFMFFFDLERGKWEKILPIATRLSFGKMLSFLSTTRKPL